MLLFIKNILGGKKKTEPTKEEERPDSGKIILNGKMKNKTKLRNELRSLSMFSDVSLDKEEVNAMVIESTDRNKNPHLYIKFTFNENGLEVFYSITPEVANPALRKLEVSKTVFTLLSLLENRDAFNPDKEDLYSKVIEAFDISTSFSDTDALRMKYEMDKFSKENIELKKSLAKLTEEKEGLNHQLLELEKRCEQLDGRVNKLEAMTDSELDREIIKWVDDHYGKLDEEKFCSSLSVSGSRLEERLDSLSKNGVIRIV
jgi:hypothetical protein